MRKFSKSRRGLKQAGLVVSVLVLVVMAAVSLWFVGYAKVQTPLWTLILVLGWFAIISIAVTSIFLLLRDWHRGDATPYCPTCDYILTGNESGFCPECGSPIPNGDLTLSGRPPIVEGNPLEQLEGTLSRRYSTGAKVFMVYLAYVSIVIAVISFFVWAVARKL